MKYDEISSRQLILWVYFNIFYKKIRFLRFLQEIVIARARWIDRASHRTTEGPRGSRPAAALCRACARCDIATPRSHLSRLPPTVHLLLLTTFRATLPPSRGDGQRPMRYRTPLAMPNANHDASNDIRIAKMTSGIHSHTTSTAPTRLPVYIVLYFINAMWSDIKQQIKVFFRLLLHVHHYVRGVIVVHGPPNFFWRLRTILFLLLISLKIVL